MHLNRRQLFLRHTVDRRLVHKRKSTCKFDVKIEFDITVSKARRITNFRQQIAVLLVFFRQWVLVVCCALCVSVRLCL